MKFRKDILIIILFAGVVCSFACSANKDVKPNFIIIFTDDQGYQDLGCFGSPNIKTPNIDKMASEGIKTSAWEGGLRVPCIVRAPGKVPEGIVSDQLTATIDLLPTIAKLAGAELPADRVIDGIDISQILKGESTELNRPYFYYQHQELRAVRLGKWKLHLPHHPELKVISYTKWPKHVAPEDRVLFDDYVLYDVDKDIGETNNVAAANPEVVTELAKLLDWARKDIGDVDQRGENARSLGDEPYFTPNELIPTK